MMKTLKATYNGYTGIAYGNSSFSVYNLEGREIFHTGFLRNRPKTEEECRNQLKDILNLIKGLRSGQDNDRS